MALWFLIRCFKECCFYWVPVCVYLPLSFFQVLKILFLRFSIGRFFYVLSISIFYWRNSASLLHFVVPLSLCILYRFVIIFFRYLWKSCFACIIWPCLRIFLSLFLPLFFDRFLLVVLSVLSAVVVFFYYSTVFYSFPSFVFSLVVAVSLFVLLSSFPF